MFNNLLLKKLLFFSPLLFSLTSYASLEKAKTPTSPAAHSQKRADPAARPRGADQLQEGPLLVVVLMAKDEELNIRRTLEPFVEGGVKHFLVFDTGSTDNTVSLTREFFEKKGIKEAFIEEEPFVDFATSRNRALELAEKRFPDAVFMIMPDVEWYIHNVKGLLEFCSREKSNMQCEGSNEPCAVYLIRLLATWTDFYHGRVLRVSKHPRFVGVVHEVIPSQGKIPPDIHFNWAPSAAGGEKSYKRYQRDKELLLKEHHKNPLDTRTLFYLAQTYDCLNELENAHHYYDLRAKLSKYGWDEENYMALYRLGDVTERLSKNNNAYTWEMAMKYYLEAFTLRPQRAEPLIRIAKHYLAQGNMQLSCIFGQKAMRIRYPKDDALFIDKNLYDYDRFDIVGQCGWHVGDCEIGLQAVQYLLKTYRDPHLFHNFHAYQDGKCTEVAKEEIAKETISRKVSKKNRFFKYKVKRT